MATKQVIISNIKFNLSTEPLVSEPEIYPDYKYDMSTEELSNRLTQILQGIIINEEPNTIQGFVQNFIEDFVPDQDYVISITDIEGYERTLAEYYAWDKDEDGPIPGLKLFKDLNIYLEREYGEY
jgi:hypothetical protein